MTNLGTKLLEILTRQAVRFCSSTAFPGPDRANAYGPQMGLSLNVLQRKD